MKKTFAPLLLFITIVCTSLPLSAQTTWSKQPNPVLPRSATYPAWDGLATADACILLVNDTFKTWYSGAGWLPNDTLVHVSIGYAWSLDGLSWTAYAGNPVYQHSTNPNDADFHGTETASVLYDSTAPPTHRYRMWYSGKQDESDPNGDYKVCYAYSPNGITWTRYAGNPVMLPGDSTEWHNRMITNVTVILDNGLFKMWFASPDIYFNNQATDFKGNIGYATSPDGITWTKHPTPVLQAGVGGSPDSAVVAEPCVLKIGATYYMWYSMINSWAIENFSVGHAWSNDGINWIKAANNPVLPLGGVGAWDRYWSAHPGVVYDAQTQQLYMLYTGRDSTDFSSLTSFTWDLGLATSPFITGIEENQETDMLIYPQPASDVLYVQLPTSEVQLKLMDLNGRIVFTQTASFVCEIPVGNLPAGMYMLFIETNDGKMLAKRVIKR